MWRDREALALSSDVGRLFHWLDARGDVGKAGGALAQLERTYLGVVREWGQSIEFSDRFSAGHCERVAQNAVAVARSVGLDERHQMAIRVGAYLHDLGRVRVPRDIQNKPGPLTPEEFEIVQMLPIWGTEILANVELPWDIKPIVRWHHEKYDGTGYPDRLRGDEIPLSAQIVGITNVYDALTTERAYRGALTQAQALEEMTRCRSWWSDQVFEACMHAVGATYAGPLRLA
jgi:HD-GYP domain-containing protein (c-di-GMP phosphodiesterase class II)